MGKRETGNSRSQAQSKWYERETPESRSKRRPKDQSSGLERSARYVKTLRKRATAAELALCRLLDAAHISYVFQSNIVDLKTGRTYISDFRIRRTGCPRRLYVEVDGGWHLDRQKYDQERTDWIQRKRNAVVLRFSNEDVFDRGSEVIAEIEGFEPARRTANISKTSPFRRRHGSKLLASSPSRVELKPRLVKPLPPPRLVKRAQSDQDFWAQGRQQAAETLRSLLLIDNHRAA